MGPSVEAKRETMHEDIFMFTEQIHCVFLPSVGPLGLLEAKPVAPGFPKLQTIEGHLSGG